MFWGKFIKFFWMRKNRLYKEVIIGYVKIDEFIGDEIVCGCV